MTPRVEILPPAQRVFWDGMAGLVPPTFVLYGGTAIALRRGHRQSLDFDFFSDVPLDHEALLDALPALERGEVLQKGPVEFTVRLMAAGDPVKVSFFGGLAFGRVGSPDPIPGRAAIAAPVDLLATKLKALHDRIEPKDYLDIEALLRGGLTLNEGLSACMALFGASLNPLDTAKAVAWFKDGGLESALPAGTRTFLEAASAGCDPHIRPSAIRSRSLAAS